jgi:hypothetical protein
MARLGQEISYLRSPLHQSAHRKSLARLIRILAKARTIMDAFTAKYPWWSDQLEPRRDLWGEPIANKKLTFGTAIYQSPESRDLVNSETYRLNVRKAPVDKKIRNIELSALNQYDALLAYCWND